LRPMPATMPNSARWARVALINGVRWRRTIAGYDAVSRSTAGPSS
jgi:hypothetical protein